MAKRKKSAERRSLEDKPLAAPGLISYRYRGRYGWIMIGAKDHGDALREAARSTDGPIDVGKLEVWDDASERYVPTREWNPGPKPRKNNPAIGHGRGLTKKDKAVIRAFIEGRPAESKKLYTDGMRLDGLWMGGSGIAEWVLCLDDACPEAWHVPEGHIAFRDEGSRSGQAVQRALVKALREEWPYADFGGSPALNSNTLGRKKARKRKSNPSSTTADLVRKLKF